MSQPLDNAKEQALSMETLETCFQCGQKKPLKDFLVSDNQSKDSEFSTICASCRGQLVEQEQEQALSQAHIGDADIEQQQLFDADREQQVLDQIRQEEAQRFGHVDASTHKSQWEHDLNNTEGLDAIPDAKQHPILQKSPYFSGIDDNRNNPNYAMNQEAEQRYKNQELQKQYDKQLQNSNQRQFDPQPGKPS